MKDIIRKIMTGVDIDKIFSAVIGNLYQNGPVSVTDMEILSYLTLYQQDKFHEYENTILNYMAVFYKETTKKTLKDVVFGQYRKHINDNFGKPYTPVQANIISHISGSNCFSFSAPTSTGKSYVFVDLILGCENDVVVVVPSRALINEYYLKLCDLIQDKTINILTFIDKINTNFAKRSVFVVTPERCRELFKQKAIFSVDLFLFDEAQLSNEDSKRGLYFDSIVRRAQKAYPNAKYVFAHPFIKNPESQIKKNHFDITTSASAQYVQKNVGQLFLCKDKSDNYYHFGIDATIMGSHKRLCEFDPIGRTINRGGSVLVYISKKKILDKTYLTQFRKYINLCTHVPEEANYYINKLKEYIGGNTVENRDYYSQMISLLNKGIVIHHGSLPLQTRIIIEQFTRAGFCRLCFATSTLEQGINMPFDVVYLDRLEHSKPLSVKNLIGRAGRSSIEPKFDYGFVIINTTANINNFRSIINNEEILDEVSGLEKSDPHDSDYNDFKDAILNGTFSDEYNLTNKEIETLSAENTDDIIDKLLDSVFVNGELILSTDIDSRLSLYENFNKLYSLYLGRELTPSEINILTTSIKIIIWRVYGKTFKNICWYRYSYVARTRERRGGAGGYLNAKFITGYNDIPDRNLPVYSLFPNGTKAKDVDYDTIVYDTYDYIDKLIGFKLSDIFFAAFTKYFERKEDQRALKLAKFIKYGTDNEKYIWMLRYGLDFEEIEILDPHIDSINAEQIKFKESIHEIPEEQKVTVSRFIN